MSIRVISPPGRGEREEESNVSVLKIDGLSEQTSHELLDAVRLALADGTRRVVVDLEVDVLDSSGLRTLVQCHRLCSEALVPLEVGAASDCALRAIRMAGLDRMFGLPETNSCQTTAQVRDRAEPEPVRTMEHVITSDAAMISHLREKVEEAAVEAGAAGDALCDIKIAVGEALTNAYKHGSLNKGKDQISLRCIVCENALAVEVQDEGEPFSPPGGTLNPGDLPENGMGIHLMRLAMDVVEFRFNCPGNRVRMIKWLGT